jgi:hypothetical protein
MERSHVGRCALVKGHSRGGERDGVGGPVKQLRAQLALQLRHRAADGPFCDPKLLRRLGEAGLLRHGHEGGQELERRGFVSHGVTLECKASGARGIQARVSFSEQRVA